MALTVARLELLFPNVTPPLVHPERQRAAAESARPLSRSHGVVTGARIVLWLGSYARPCSPEQVSRALHLDVKHVRESLRTLASLGLLQTHEITLRGVRPVTMYALLGGSDVVPTPKS